MAPTPKLLWLLAGLVALGVAGHTLLVACPRQAATVARLAAVDSCLVGRNQQLAAAATGTFRTLAQAVAKNRYQRSDLAVLASARQIQTSTRQLTTTLQQLRQSWPASGTPAVLVRLPGQLQQFTDTLRHYAPNVPTLTLPDWRQLAAPAARAALIRLETQARRVATESLTYQAYRVGTNCGFDKIGAFATAASNTVSPGAPYEASLMLSAVTGGLYMRLLADSRELEKDPRTNHGLVTFRVPPARPDQPDTVRAQWRGEVRFIFNGRDSVQQLTVPYFIVKRPQL